MLCEVRGEGYGPVETARPWQARMCVTVGRKPSLPTWDHEKGLQTTETPKSGLSPQHFSHHISCEPRRDGLCAAWGMRRVHRSRIKSAPKQVLSEGHGVTQGVKRQEVMTWRYTGDD